MGLRRGAAWRYAGTQHGAAQGRSVGLRRSVAWGRVRARHGAVQGRGAGLHTGVVSQSMVWYGMVWYGMVWYGMVWYGMVWYVVVVVVVRAPSTWRREKLPNTLSLGRAQGSSRPASRWPGVCRKRPRGGGGGGGMEGPPVRGPTGPRFPSLPAATPPRQGRGLRPVRRWSKGGGGGGDYVWSIPWCPSLCPVCGRPRGTAGGGAQAWAGRVGSVGGRGGGGAMRVRGPWRSRGGVGGPAGGRRWP